MEFSMKYFYQRGVSPPGWPVISQDLSRHHMISYPFMYCFGVIYLTWLYRLEEVKRQQSDEYKVLRTFLTTRGVAANTLDNALKAIRTEKTNQYILMTEPSACNHTPSLRAVLNNIAWAEYNLFIGPAGCLRADDPSQKDDATPLSMPLEQKGAVNELMATYKKYLKSVIPHISGENSASNVRCSEDGMTEIMRNLRTLLNNTTYGRIHESKVFDWGVMDNSDTKYKTVYRFHDVKSLKENEQGREKRFKYILLQTDDQTDLDHSAAIVSKSPISDNRTCSGAIRGPKLDQKDEDFSTFFARVP